jgi:hypothetical protein
MSTLKTIQELRRPDVFLFCIGFPIFKLVPVYSPVAMQHPPGIVTLKRIPNYVMQEKTTV